MYKTEICPSLLYLKQCAERIVQGILQYNSPSFGTYTLNIMIQRLKNDKKSMNIVHFEGKTSFYNISNSEDKMR